MSFGDGECDGVVSMPPIITHNMTDTLCCLQGEIKLAAACQFWETSFED